MDRAPFYDFCPLPIPYMFYGNNFAARVIPTQNARTVLTRGILDHTAITTNPRWGVVKGGLLNPKEMIENRLGGLVNMTRPDAVKALEQANLNPFVFQTLEMLKSNKEESTGISALSQGLNKDAISTQNSAALVDNLVDLVADATEDDCALVRPLALRPLPWHLQARPRQPGQAQGEGHQGCWGLQACNDPGLD